MKRSERLLKKALRLILLGVSMMLAAVAVGSFSYVLWLNYEQFASLMLGVLAVWLLIWGVIHCRESWDEFRVGMDELAWEIGRNLNDEGGAA